MITGTRDICKLHLRLGYPINEDQSKGGQRFLNVQEHSGRPATSSTGPSPRRDLFYI